MKDQTNIKIINEYPFEIFVANNRVFGYELNFCLKCFIETQKGTWDFDYD